MVPVAMADVAKGANHVTCVARDILSYAGIYPATCFG